MDEEELELTRTDFECFDGLEKEEMNKTYYELEME